MKFIVANDNGNSEQKISINGEVYHQPNVYQLHQLEPLDESPLEVVMHNLLNEIAVTIDSKALDLNAETYIIGERALTITGSDNMNIGASRKHEEDIPVINTLGILAAIGTKKRYEEKKELTEGETIELEVDMTTALPVSISDKDKKTYFANRFKDNYHEVKVHFNNTHTTVKIKFTNVNVVAEGVPTIFSLIEDGEGNYRSDDMFDEFKEQYSYKNIDGEHFLDKRLLHVDIGDGTTELTFTQGYSEDKERSKGLKYGFGETLEKVLVDFEREMEKYNLSIKRQNLSKYLKNNKHEFHDYTSSLVNKYSRQLVKRLFKDIKERARILQLEFDIIVVYGGGSILLKESLYDLLVNEYKSINKEVLWIPKQYAVDMNLKGMEIFNSISLQSNES